MKKKGLFSSLKELFFGPGHEDFYEEMEDILLEADLGVRTAVEVGNRLKALAKSDRLKTKDDLRAGLRAILDQMILSVELKPDPARFTLYMVLGVNGVGKTTSIAKLTRHFGKNPAHRILLAAGDTFRAAAIEQLKLHGDRQGVRVVAQDHGSDPGAVLFDALESAKAKGETLVLCDTAGRMHNKANLVKELQKVHKIAQSKTEGGDYKKILVLDSTTGQNAFAQAEVFHEAVGVDAIILSKYDSSGKGGTAVAISHQLGIPFAFVGLGEKADDLAVFDKATFIEGLLGAE